MFLRKFISDRELRVEERLSACLSAPAPAYARCTPSRSMYRIAASMVVEVWCRATDGSGYCQPEQLSWMFLLSSSTDDLPPIRNHPPFDIAQNKKAVHRSAQKQDTRSGIHLNLEGCLVRSKRCTYNCYVALSSAHTMNKIVMLSSAPHAL